MCNSNLYDYQKSGLAKSFQLFGAMIVPANDDAQEPIYTKAKKAGFTILKEEAKDDEETCSNKL
jgi:hypothetical protein